MALQNHGGRISSEDLAEEAGLTPERIEVIDPSDGTGTGQGLFTVAGHG
ncbi:hypothetical protein [Streptomyces sp. NPDC057199]